MQRADREGETSLFVMLRILASVRKSSQLSGVRSNLWASHDGVWASYDLLVRDVHDGAFILQLGTVCHPLP